MPRQSTDHKKTVALLNPSSPISEVYRTLRTNIQFSSFDSEIKVVMVTSSVKGEGKTTTISNLAVAYAQEAKKVLLIDCDLRTPSLHRTFSQSNQIGLSNILANQHPWQDIIRDTAIDNLSLLTGGPIPPNPAELLGSANMGKLIEELKPRYDLILLDTQPLLTVSDSLIVNALCDGVVLVVLAGKVEKKLVKKAKASLDHVNAHHIGLVLNQINRSERRAALSY